MGLLCGIIGAMIATILRGVIVTIICIIPINIVSGSVDYELSDTQGVIDTTLRDAAMRIDLELITPILQPTAKLIEGSELDKLGKILPQSFQVDSSLRAN